MIDLYEDESKYQLVEEAHFESAVRQTSFTDMVPISLSLYIYIRVYMSLSLSLHSMYVYVASPFMSICSYLIRSG